MKRDMKDINLQNAFWPMTEECHDRLTTALSGLREEQPVKRFTARTVLIAACIIVALMAVAYAAGRILGWTDMYSEYYDITVPDEAQQIMKDNGETSYVIGPATFTIGGMYCDGHIATVSANVRLAEGTKGLLCGESLDPINENEDGIKLAEKLGVDPGLSWSGAAKQMNLPLYSVRLALELPDGVQADCMESYMLNEDGSLTYFTMGAFADTFKEEKLDCQVYLRVEEVTDNPEGRDEAIHEYKDISIPLGKPLKTVEYAVPENVTVGYDDYRLDAVRAELMPGGLYLIAVLTDPDGEKEPVAAKSDAWNLASDLSFLDPDGEPYEYSLSLSGAMVGIESWPVIEVNRMVPLTAIPETVRLHWQNPEETTLELELKK